MLTITHSIIFGIVEGISEFLPISSTGHLILAAKLMGLAQTDFLKSFEIAIQLGAILSVVILYWRSFLVNLELLKRVVVAFIPTAVIGLFLYKIVKNFLLGSSSVVIWSLFIGGIVLIIFELWHRGKPEAKQDLAKMPYKKAFWIGVFQSIAIIPGVSRSAATIVGGMLMGIDRASIVEFSFLLAAPTMAAATGLDLFKSAGEFNSSQYVFLAAGFIASFITAIIAIKFLVNYIKKHTFIPFGIYRIAIAVLFWLIA
jgi:undecaprenyl-diphosphatase